MRGGKSSGYRPRSATASLEGEITSGCRPRSTTAGSGRRVISCSNERDEGCLFIKGGGFDDDNGPASDVGVGVIVPDGKGCLRLETRAVDAPSASRQAGTCHPSQTSSYTAPHNCVPSLHRRESSSLIRSSA